ncbi:MAG: TRAP transporter substrate-binding protein DctP, partial [Bacteroidota bacterium]
GQKIRVMESITAMDMVRNLSGSPTPISAGELYTALQQGVVDGAENNPPTFYSSRHYEVCKYYSLDEHATIPDVMLISTHLWDTLNHQQQSWLQAAMDSSIVYQRKLWAETEKKALEEVKKAGVTISYPDKTEFKKKVAPIYHFYKNDGTIGKLIDRIQSVQ